MRRAIVGATFFLAACGDATSTVVIIEADPGVASIAESLDVQVLGGHVDAGLEQRFQDRVEAPIGWPVRLTVAPEAGDASRTFDVTATARGGSGSIIGRVRARSGFVRGRVKQLVLRLEDCCRARAAECTTDETCAGCECVAAPVLDPDDLPDWPADAGPWRDAGGASDGGPPDAGFDAAADEDACVPQTLYLDADGDGYGDPTSSIAACLPRAGYVDRADDCDDDCAECHPGAIESCDGIRDESCNGAVNEGCPCAPDRPEACNLADDDCDAMIDEDAVCPVTGQSCMVGTCACPDGLFPCGGACQTGGSCSVGVGSCRNDGVLVCQPGGTVGCSVGERPRICTPSTTSACDPCGGGSAVGGTTLCDAYGCATGSCLAGSGRVLAEYAPAWSHACGVAHDTSGQNWRCDSSPTRCCACVCAERSLRLPGGSYRLRVTAGFPPIDTPMIVRVVQTSGEIASATFNVVGLEFTTHQLDFALSGCTDITIRIEREASRVEYVINRITLDRL